MKNGKSSFYVPGIYHKILVKLVTYKWLARFTKDKGIMGAYDYDTAKLYLVKALSLEVKRHTFYHEISHHIIEVLANIQDEEIRCDVLGKYLIDLADSREEIDSGLTGKDEEND